jgi:O-antigen/teichoic acid export membrane protein
MHSSYPLIGILIMTSPFIFEAIFGTTYKSSASIFNVYLLLTLTQLIFPQSILTARGDTKLLWYISLAELAVNIVASIILLRYFGLIGIAWGTLIAFVFEKMVLLYFLNTRYKITPSMIVDLRVWGGYAFVLIIIYAFSIWVFGV